MTSLGVKSKSDVIKIRCPCATYSANWRRQIRYLPVRIEDLAGRQTLSPTITGRLQNIPFKYFLLGSRLSLSNNTPTVQATITGKDICPNAISFRPLGLLYADLFPQREHELRTELSD